MLEWETALRIMDKGRKIKKKNFFIQRWILWRKNCQHYPHKTVSRPRAMCI
jgi:hypothetical protein